jgi:CHAT domain-containing protein
LRGGQLLHFSGHAYSDHGNPERSALLVAPAGGLAADPFPGSLWSVDEGFTALYADVFYEQLAAGTSDLGAAVRNTRRWLREARKADVTARLDRLADEVRAEHPRTAMVLEAYRYTVTARRDECPYDSPWEWASFYAVGGATIDLTGGTDDPGPA